LNRGRRERGGEDPIGKRGMVRNRKKREGVWKANVNEPGGGRGSTNRHKKKLGEPRSKKEKKNRSPVEKDSRFP